MSPEEREKQRLLPYEAALFRIDRSFCPDCGSTLRHLRPVDPERALDMPSFFVCTECPYVGQVGSKRLWPRETS